MGKTLWNNEYVLKLFTAFEIMAHVLAGTPFSLPANKYVDC